MADWSNFFLGELGAAAALAGLLFVAVSVNQARILALGRMADRGLEALAMLFLILIIASFPLIPGQPMRLLGGEILVLAVATLIALVPLQRAYIRSTVAEHVRNSRRMVRLNRLAISIIALSGAVLLWRADLDGLYLLPCGILLVFVAVGINAWVLLVEINR
jgi:hypothetical protein